MYIITILASDQREMKCDKEDREKKKKDKKTKKKLEKSFQQHRPERT